MKIIGDRLFLKTIEHDNETTTKHGFVIPCKKNTDYSVGKIVYVGNGENVKKLYEENLIVEYECVNEVIDYDKDHVIVPHSCVFAIRT